MLPVLVHTWFVGNMPRTPHRLGTFKKLELSYVLATKRLPLWPTLVKRSKATKMKRSKAGLHNKADP